MGTTFSNTLMEKTRGLQEEVLNRQTDNIIRNQERVRRMQVAMQLAVVRERFPWIAGTYAGGVAFATVSCIRARSIQPVAVVLSVLGGILTSYQYSLAHGNMLERANARVDVLLYQENHWFSKLMPSDAEVQKMKQL